MKKNFYAVIAAAVVIFCGSALQASSARPKATATGEMAPALTAREFVKGDAVTLESMRGKKPVVLLFWTGTPQGIASFGKVIEAYNKFGGKAQFIGVAIDKPDALKDYPPLEDLPFPVAADDAFQTLFCYLRDVDTIPCCAIVGKDGRIFWRGQAGALSPVLGQVLDGSFDLDAAVAAEEYGTRLSQALRVKDNDKVLLLLDEGIERFPEQRFLLTARKVQWLSDTMGRPDDALKTVEQAVAAEPDNFRYYELGVNLMRHLKRYAELDGWFDRIIARFGDNHQLLSKLAMQEMGEDVATMRPGYVYKLSRAAYQKGKFDNDREKGLAALEYARSLYLCGRPDLAMTPAKEAMKLLKDTPDYAGAQEYVKFYFNVIKISGSLGDAESK